MRLAGASVSADNHCAGRGLLFSYSSAVMCTFCLSGRGMGRGGLLRAASTASNNYVLMLFPCFFLYKWQQCNMTRVEKNRFVGMSFFILKLFI